MRSWQQPPHRGRRSIPSPDKKRQQTLTTSTPPSTTPSTSHSRRVLSRTDRLSKMNIVKRNRYQVVHNNKKSVRARNTAMVRPALQATALQIARQGIACRTGAAINNATGATAPSSVEGVDVVENFLHLGHLIWIRGISNLTVRSHQTGL